MKPLHGLIADYHKAQKIKWSSDVVIAFNTVKIEVSKCTTMHFLNDFDPIYLHTDASDYGIGDYLFQIVDGLQHPAPVARSCAHGLTQNGLFDLSLIAVGYSRS